ncbi:guanylate kinase [bacterium]|nr:guanylate kinase [bacterium]
MSSPGGDPRPTSRGLLLVLSGPSGSGKSTLVRRLLEPGDLPVSFSVSATSRPPRPGEVPGEDYIFLSRDEFLAMRERGEFLESAAVHENLYGTPRQPVEEAIGRGEWVLLEIDVQGHQQVKDLMPEAISFFIRASDLSVYEDRLRGRNTESEAEIALRMDNVRAELSRAVEYDFQIVNEDIEQAIRMWRTLLAGIQSLRGH